MEEDAGKLVHAGSDRRPAAAHSLVDTTAPVWAAKPSCFQARSAARAGRRPNTLRKSRRDHALSLASSDGNKQEGSLALRWC